MTIATEAPTTSRGVLSVQPVELRVAVTYPSGSPDRLTLTENHDLAISEVAGDIFRQAESGHIAVALEVDGEHDEVHYRGMGDDAYETLTRGIEVLTLAREAYAQARQEHQL